MRAQLRAFFDGKDVDLCALWRLVACCCARHRHGGKDGGDTWTGSIDPGISFFIFPTDVEYTVEYAQPFPGQFGPIPFDDPWWKLLLIIIAIILTIAAAISGGADLANHSDDAVIGTLTRSVLNPLKTAPTSPPAASDPGSVDAAVVTLNGNRGLTPAIFTVLDAATGEASTTPIETLGGKIDTPGTILTNAQITAIFQNLADNPGDPSAQDAVRVFKSGSRSGTSSGLLTGGDTGPAARQRKNGSTGLLPQPVALPPRTRRANALSCPAIPARSGSRLRAAPWCGLNHAGSDGSDAIACASKTCLRRWTSGSREEGLMSTAQKRLPLEQAAAAEGRRLAKDPNVVMVGFGLKFVGGQPTMDVALHYYVREKLAEADAIRQRGSEPVPLQAEGYPPTCSSGRSHARPPARTVDRPTGDRGSRREEPLVGGTSTAILGGFSTSSSTMGRSVACASMPGPARRWRSPTPMSGAATSAPRRSSRSRRSATMSAARSSGWHVAGRSRTSSLGLRPAR